MKKFREILAKIFKVFRYAVHEFIADDGFNLAAGLSFFAILSIIPLALIIISLLGHVLGRSDEIFEQITLWVKTTLPYVQPDFIEFLRQLVDKKFTSGWIGLVFLFFVASLLFTNIEHLLDKVLKSSRKRNFLHSRAFSILLIIITAFLFFVPSQINLVRDYFPTQKWLEFFPTFFTGNLTYFLTHAVVFFLLLNFVPNESMHKAKIAVGALVFSAMTILAKQAFRWYMGLALERYHFIYGSLTVLVVLVLWIYYLSLMFVFCAEIVSSLQKYFPKEA